MAVDTVSGVTQTDRTPRIRKVDPCPCIAPKIWATWCAVWGAMDRLGTKRDRWQRPAAWAKQTETNTKTVHNLLLQAHRQGLVRKRLNGAGYVVFARVDVVAKIWSARETEAFERDGWRWRPWDTC